MPVAVANSAYRDRGFIAVLGYDHDTQNVLLAAIALGFTPVFIHSPYGTLPDDTNLIITRQEVDALAGTKAYAPSFNSCSVKIVQAEEFCGLLDQSAIPVIVGAYGIRDRDYFREHLLFGRNKLKIRGAILHPASLCDIYKFPCRRFAITGFPGSGNMIIQNIAQRLVEQVSASVWSGDRMGSLMAHLAISYWSSLRGYLVAPFDEFGRWQDLTGPSHTRYGVIDISLRDEPSPIVFAGLPLRSYAWANPFHTSHEPLTDLGLSFFERQNFLPIQILRHPLDVIVSNASKITSFSGERAPQILLQNDAWMSGMLAILEAYYSGMVEHARKVSCVRYEELLSSPVATIRRFSEVLGVEKSETDCSKIWSELHGRTLSADAGHYWDPRAGKWHEFISPRFAKLFCQSRLREYAEAMDYQIAAEDFRGGNSEIRPNMADPFNIAWRDARWEGSTGKPPNVPHSDVYRVHDSERGQLFIGGRRYAGVIESIQRSTAFADILNAASLIQWKEPSLIAEYLGIR